MEKKNIFVQHREIVGRMAQKTTNPPGNDRKSSPGEFRPAFPAGSRRGEARALATDYLTTFELAGEKRE